LCQRTSRFGADQAVSEALVEAKSQLRVREAELGRLWAELRKTEDSRKYLLKQVKGMKVNAADPPPPE